MSYLRIWISKIPYRFHLAGFNFHLNAIYANGADSIRVSRIKRDSDNESMLEAVLAFQEQLQIAFPGEIKLCSHCRMAYVVEGEDPFDHDLHRDSGSLFLLDFVRKQEQLRKECMPEQPLFFPDLFGRENRGGPSDFF